MDVLEESKIDVALISTNLPDGDAINLVECINEEHPDVKVIGLGMVEAEAVVIHYIEAGAVGYIFREQSAEDMLTTIRAAHHDKAHVSPEIAASMMTRLNKLSNQLTDIGIDASLYQELTAREKEILDLISAGSTNQEIAKELTIELGTVKNHVHNILGKLNVNSRKDAATYLSLVHADEANDVDCD